MPQKRVAQAPAATSESLAKLYRLYDRNQISRDAFGRRPALPSEIAQQLKRYNRTTPAKR
jgi:hypothetical protein